MYLKENLCGAIGLQIIIAINNNKLLLKTIIVVYLTSSCVNWVLKAYECQKMPNLHKNELNTTFFCSRSPLKTTNRLKSFYKISLTFRFDKL
jgi:hypothetical protein